MKRTEIPKEELVGPGHLACQGCGATITMRLALKALGPNTVLVLPACCWSVLTGPHPHYNLGVPLLHTAFETCGAAASGVRAALDMQGKSDVTVVGWAGDGGTFDIGIQALSGAAERNENILHICYDNEAYMNTGIQRSSSTPLGSWTTTTPEDRPKERPKKNMIEVFAGHRIPYAATANIAFPEDLMEKLLKAKSIKGMRFLHVLSPCPPGWRCPSEKSVKVARLATDAKVFPLYEVIDGDRYVITVQPKGTPVTEYFKYQRRFAHLGEEEVKEVQARVDFEWQRLLNKSMMESFEQQS